MFFGMVESPLGPDAPDSSFSLVCYNLQHDSPAFTSLLPSDNGYLAALGYISVQVEHSLLQTGARSV